MERSALNLKISKISTITPLSLLPHPNTRHFKGSVESLYHNKLSYVLQKGSFRDISGNQLLTLDYESLKGFPGNASGKEPACQCCRYKRCGFSPWVRKIPWRRQWQPIPAFLPGESHGQRSLEKYSPQDRKELDMTEVTQHTHEFPKGCV